MTNKAVLAAIALIAVFVAGFFPQYRKANRLESELRQSRQDAAGAELRDLIGFAYLQANQKNFGLAAQTSSRFFNRVREVATQTQDTNRRKALEELLMSRDSITAALAKGDAAVIGDLQQLFVNTRLTTRSANEP